MRINVKQSELYKSLKAAGRAVPSSAPMPILKNLLLKVEKDKVSVISTDLELGIEVDVNVNRIFEPGEELLPADKFTKIIKQLDNENIVIESKSNKTTIKTTGHNKYQISSQKSEEFPDLPEVDQEEKIIIEGAKLKEMINLTNFATSTDENRPFLQGTLFSIGNDTITLAATDTYRLSAKKEQLISDVDNIAAIVPSETCRAVKSLINNKKVTVSTNSNQMLFEQEGIKIVSRLMSGDFPDYKQVIPDEEECIIEFDRRELISAAKRTKIFSENDVIKLSKKKGYLILTSNDDTGEAFEKIEVREKKISDDINIAFNSKYLTQVLSKLDSDDVEMKLTDGLSPALITEQDYSYVIMPVRSD